MSFKIMVKIEDGEVRTLLAGMQTRTGSLSPAMKIIGEIVQTSIRKNFEKGGRPEKWAGLKPSTIRQREKQGLGAGNILIRLGLTGGLMGSISYRPYADKVVVSANKIYAAIHQFGGKAGRGHKITIPARPYMLVQAEDWVEIRQAVIRYITGGAK